MDGVIRVRFPNELWWDEVTMENASKWNRFEVSYLGDDTSFVIIDGQAMEMKTSDYNMLVDKKAFRLKFKLKKHDPFAEKKEPDLDLSRYRAVNSVTIEERDFSFIPIRTEEGPINEPIRINNRDEFEEIFGETDD